MADNYETMNQESPNYGCFKEAVCIDASRVYDSCGDKDCLEDLRVYFFARVPGCHRPGRSGAYA